MKPFNTSCKTYLLFSLILSIFWVAGCLGGSDSNTIIAAPPSVTFTVPGNSVTSVAINKKITAVFSEVMNSATINGASFTIKESISGKSVPGTVASVDKFAVFTPSANMAINTTHIATITTEAKNPAGVPIAGNYSWSFTSGDALDVTAPAVSFTSPVNAGTDILVNRKINISFSEDMDPLSITTATFTLKQGTANVSGIVTTVGPTATFTPSANLANSTLYTATITTGARDMAGNALAGDFTFSFTTGAIADSTAPVVSVTSPTNTAVDVPVNRVLNVGFSEEIDPLSITTATFTLKQGTTNISGAVAAVGTTATFTPSVNLANSMLYTATITTGVRDLAGNALAANYTFSFTTGAAADSTAPVVSVTSPTNSAVDVPVNRVLNIGFSEDMNSSSITTATFTLKQGTTNISGTVAATGTTATFTPSANLANSTLYTATIMTGVKDLAGNSLAANYTFSFTTGAAADIIAPTVGFTSPTDTSPNVPVNRILNVDFSEVMNPATITTATFTLKQGTTPVLGVVTYTGTTATFTPSANLANSTLYTAAITTGVKDLAGNAMAANYSWSFTTGAALDTTAPTVTLTAPVNAAVNAPINTALNISFSEAMTPSSITTVTFTLKQGATPVSGVVTYTGTTATFTPSANLSNSTVYTAAITTGVKDLAGNSLAANYSWSFTTAAAADSTPPTVSFTAPANAAVGVPINRVINISFNEDMNPASLTSTTITMKETVSGISVPGTVTPSSNSAAFTPSANLKISTQYTATITTGVSDLAGNAMVVNFVFSFTTGAVTDFTAPTVISTDPADNSTEVALNSKIAATFSESMDSTSITIQTFSVKETVSGNSVPGTITPAAGATATFVPTGNLTLNTNYTATITTGVKDLAGNILANSKIWSFKTVSDSTPPLVSVIYPADGAQYVGVKEAITAVFSETMDPASITALTFKVQEGANPALAATVVYASAGSKATLTPSSDLLEATTYSVTLTTGVKDLAGNALASSKTWSFKTGQASPVLGRGSAFSLMATTTITGTTGSNINGDVGLNPNGSITIAVAEMHGGIHNGDQAIIDAQADLLTAYDSVAAKATNVIVMPTTELGGLTLTPGLYKAAPSFKITAAGGDLTLDAQGNPNAVFIFQMPSSTLTVDPGCKIILANQANANNIYWQAGSSATLGSGCSFYGNVLAKVSITVNSGSIIVGRLLAGTGTAGAGAVEFNSSTISLPLP